MAVRRESVVLDLDDRLTPGLIRAAAAAGVLDRELNKLDGQSTRTSRGIAATEAEVRNLDRTAGGSTRTIDRYSGRIGLLGDAILTLGPAAVTVGATAVPAVAALSSELGFAAVGAGTVMLAFKDLGPALTAFNKAAAAPTATNIAAAQTAMDKIPPSAQRFVLELHRLNPEMAKLRQAAGSGLFEGLTSGIHAAERDLPLARKALRGVSTELGSMADQAGHALASDQWRPFLRFVGAEAPHALDDMGRAAGSVAHGLAGLWMAFGQENRTLSTGIVNLAHDFDQWANSVGRTQGFQDFLAYVNTNGPRVMDLLGQIGITLVDIGTAAAPIGGPVLEVLKSLFQVIDAIANSDFGTPLLAGLLAFRLYARAAQLAGVQVETSFRGIAAAPGQVGAGLSSLQAKTAAWSRATVADLGIVTRAWMTAGAMSEREAALQGGAMGRLRGTAGTALKGGAAAAGIALVASGLPEKMGAANTASLALMGTLAGPWGAAVGGAVGLTLDLAHANDSLVDSQKRADAAIKGTDYAASAAAIDDLSQKTSGYLDLLHQATGSLVGSPQATLTAISDAFTHQSEESTAALRELITKKFETQAALQDIGRGLGAPDMQFGQPFAANSPEGVQRLTEIAVRAQPAMDALGISMEDLQNASAASDGSLGKLAARIVAWINNADTAAGHSKAVAKAFARMGDESLTAEDRVQGLTDALDGLVDPMMNLGQANDAFHQALNDLPQALSKSSKTLRGYSDAAIQNRGAIRGLIGNVKDQVEALANVPGGASRASAALKAGRQAIIESGRAAGLNAGQIRHMIDVMGLTPKLIKTIIQADPGPALSAIQSARAALAALDGQSANVHINVTRNTNSLLADVSRADGGEIPGPRWPYRDKVLAMLAPGEQVITNRNGEADQFRADRAAGLIPHYAAGGTVAGGSTSARTKGPDPFTKATNERLRHFNAALADATKALDKERQARDAVRSAMQQQMTTVRDNFRSDFLGVDPGVWGQAMDPRSILRGDIRDARHFRTDIRHLRKRGLSAGLAGQITTLAQADQVEGMSNHDLRQLQHLFAVRQRVSSRAGQADATAAYGARLDHANTLLHQQVVEVRRLRQEVKHLHHEQAQHAKRTGDAVGDKINGASGKATRRARHP